MNLNRPSQTLLPLLGIVAAPLLLAVMGLTHPRDLTPETARYWYVLHLLLLPVFPLLGVNLWWLLAGIPGPWAWVARILTFVYIPFYGALDVLGGIATGLVSRDRGGARIGRAVAASPGWRPHGDLGS
jgi:hypothetical protein